MFKRLNKEIWEKEWSDDEINKYVGSFRECYFTYAADSNLRQNAASGGSVSALLIYLLESGQIDGALVCRTLIKEGKPRPEFFIAETRDAILSAQGSKYAAVYFTTQAFPLIKAYQGRLCVVALPCDAKILAHRRQKEPELDQKIQMVITLFCGHNSEHALVDAIVERLGKSHGELKSYVFRSGHWRGELSATFADGTEVVKPFSSFSDYRNVYFFAQPKCHHCFDHFGYFTDISAGDIWSPEMKHDPIKHTALVARTEAGQTLVEAATAAGALVSKLGSVEQVANGQARTLPFHYNVTARARVGKIFGLTIKDRTEYRVRFVDYIIAFIALFNERVSRTKLGKWLILHMPRPLLKLYLYFFKGLESI